MKRHAFFCAAVTTVIFGAGSIALAGTTTVGFDGGDPSGFSGNAFFESAGGNPGGRAHHLNDSFWQELRTGSPGEPTNAAFVGDYGQYTSVTLGFDLKVDSIANFFGNQIIMEIGINLIDHDTVGPDGPAGVFYNLGLISQSRQPNWTHMEVTISDPSSTTLPAGWTGFGAYDSFFNPILPAGSTFASVLADVDEFQVTTLVPGFFYTNNFWDISIDNVSITAVPEPGAAALLGIAALAVLRRRGS